MPCSISPISWLTLIGAGLIGVWITDLRVRQPRDFRLFAEAIRQIAVFYDGFVVPGAVLLVVSGAWMVAASGMVADSFSTPG